MIHAVSEERCNEVESLVFDLFANLGATGVERFYFTCFCAIFFFFVIFAD